MKNDKMEIWKVEKMERWWNEGREERKDGRMTGWMS